MATGKASVASSGGFFHRLARRLSGKVPGQVVFESENYAVSPQLPTSDVQDVLESEDVVTRPSSLDIGQNSLSNALERFRSFGFGMGTSNQGLTKPNLNNNIDVVPFTTATQPTTLTDRVEPTFLASKIQSLLDALPLPSQSLPEPSNHPKPPKHDVNGRPIPPPNVTPISDARLISMLQSATVMNGGKNGDDGRERRVSVWSVLDSIGDSSRCSDDGDENIGGGNEADGEEASGIMMYSPLMPTNLSLVEVAESGVPEEPQEPIVDPTSEAAHVAGWIGMWPFNSIWGNGAGVVSESIPSAASMPSPTSSLPASLPGSPNSRAARLRIQSKKRVWIPSATKLSFQAVWWGYRIYLPPPVMDILGDKTIEAAKRAAMITTALTWFFNNIPLTALPPALRPALLLMQTLIPYIGYIGSFISWSWGTIQSYDTGHGVILTATWLLPVALIPSVWDEYDFPPPSPQPPPAQPLPPAGPASPPSPDAHGQPSPEVPSPTLLPSPPSTPPPHPLIPIQVPIGLQSPTLSFVTAPTSPLQSPSRYLPLPLPLPSVGPEPSAHSPQSATPVLSPLQLSTLYPSPPALPHASEPLPPWVQPPPPPDMRTIPLPELDEEVGTPRFGFRVLGKRSSKSGEVGREKKDRRKAEGVSEGGERGRELERKRKRRLKTIMGALGSGKEESSKGARDC